MNQILRRITSTTAPFKQRLHQAWNWLRSTFAAVVTAHPLVSFFGLMAVILVVIVVGNFLRKPASEAEKAAPAPKQVKAYTVGATPELVVQASVEKSGVITVVAQTGGVVSKLNVSEGQKVARGQRLVSLSSTYQGGNAPSLTRQLSQRSYQHVVETFDAQLAVIQNNRTLAEKAEVQAKELREIGRSSEADTRSLIALNEEIIGALDSQIKAEEATSSAITPLKMQKSQMLGALNGLKAGLKSSEYANNEEQEIAGITSVSKENTLRQLDLQQKALELNRDVAQLNLRLAQIGESLMYPATPCAGVVERVHVSVGQSVMPGTVIATISANESQTTVEALVASSVAHQASRVVPSQIQTSKGSISIVPDYISTQPTSGVLHSVLFTIPMEYSQDLGDGELVVLHLPFGTTLSNNRYVPLDAVYFSQSGAFVYVIDAQKTPAQASIRKIEVGQVFGSMVEVKTGLEDTTQVILDRTVVENDPVTVW